MTRANFRGQGIIAAAVQLFFAWRVRVLTSNWLATIFVALLALAGAGMWSLRPQVVESLSINSRWFTDCRCNQNNAKFRRLSRVPDRCHNLACGVLSCGHGNYLHSSLVSVCDLHSLI